MFVPRPVHVAVRAWWGARGGLWVLTACLLGLLPARAQPEEVSFPPARPAELLEGQIYNPRFCPSNPYLVVYERQIADIHEIYLFNQRTGEVDQISIDGRSEESAGDGFFDLSTPPATSRYDGYFDWRPVLDDRGRQWFAFVSGDRGGYGFDLYLSYLDRDGRPAAEPALRLGRDGAETQPRWSPDGAYLAFIAGGANGGQVYLSSNMEEVLRDGNPDAFEVERITTDDRTNNVDPAWSPDGNFLAYASYAVDEGRPNWGINVLRTQDMLRSRRATPVRLLADEQMTWQHEKKPSWSPDGAYLAYYVSQARLGEDIDNKLQDLGVMMLERSDNGRRITGARPVGSGPLRVAENVVPNDEGGPAWLTLVSPAGPSTPALAYVLKDEPNDNPIHVTLLDRWKSGRPEASYNLSERVGFGTVLHRDVVAVTNAGGVRLAFASQVGMVKRLQVRDLSGSARLRLFQSNDGPRGSLWPGPSSTPARVRTAGAADSSSSTRGR